MRGSSPLLGRPRPASTSEVARRGVLAPALLFVAGLFVLQVGWVLSLPPYYGIDEFDHAYRATSVARGHVAAGTTPAEDGRGYLVAVPDDVVEAAFRACDELTYPGPDNCVAVTAPDADGQVLVASAAATYNPLWYAVVGAASLPFEGDRALMAMRWANVLLCDLLLLLAAALALRRSNDAWPLLGLVVLSTPVVLYATTTVAPNGAGFCAALVMWSAVLSLVRTGGHRPGVALAGLAGGAAVVTGTHATGALWVALAGLCALPVLWPTLRHLLARHRRALLVTLLALVLPAAASTAWVVLAGTNDPGDDHGGYGPAPASLAVKGPVLWVLQSVATLRFRNEAAPTLVYALGMVLLVVLLVASLRAADRGTRWSMLLVAVASLAVPLALDWSTYDDLGGAWQGRYTLPLSCGFVLLAVHGVARRFRLRAWHVGAIAVTTAVMHVVATRAMHGSGGVTTDPGPWVVLGGVAALALLGSALLLARTGRDDARPAPGPGDAVARPVSSRRP